MKLVFLMMAIASASLAETLARPLPCHQVSEQCQVCPDGEVRAPGGKNLYACLRERGESEKRLSGTSVCLKASKFCFVCQDGRFLSEASGEEINSDAYECTHGPRTILGEEK